MTRILSIFLLIIRVICVLFILWFVIYFIWGNQISLEFTDRKFAYYFPQILVFLTAVAIYLVFILSINSSRKKWKNIALFLGGSIIALFPFVIFHGYLQFQCGFWNNQIELKKELYVHKIKKTEKVNIIQLKCLKDNSVQLDTVFSQDILLYFRLVNPVKLVKTDKSDWQLVQ